MSADFDVVVIGAGVVGLAVARELSQRLNLLLIERHPFAGMETSSRNSEVIHAGLYYPPGSLKEQLCIQGKHQLYEFCDTYDVPYQQIGKLLVAQSEDNQKLIALAENASRLGIPMQTLSAADIRTLEPNVRAEAGLFSPSTGIIDSHTYMQRLLSHAETNGATVAFNTALTGLAQEEGLWSIEFVSGGETGAVTASALVNCAGLNASAIARQLIELDGLSASGGLKVPATWPCKGDYFSYQGRSPFKHLVYPMPEDNLAGLGIHATLDLQGQLKFGPDTEFLNPQSDSAAYDYDVSEDKRTAFAKAISGYFPDLDASRLQPAYAGIRPKLGSEGTAVQDFQLLQVTRHGH
ncbi:MAG: NAD(P)/FAD-dependent oxidoreductase, partial [Oceanobacter sp.]